MLLHVVFYSKIGEEKEAFDVADVCHASAISWCSATRTCLRCQADSAGMVEVVGTNKDERKGRQQHGVRRGAGSTSLGRESLPHSG